MRGKLFFAVAGFVRCDAVKKILFCHLNLLVVAWRNDDGGDKGEYCRTDKEVHRRANVVSEIDQVGCDKWCRTAEYGNRNVVRHGDASRTNLCRDKIGHDGVWH